MNPVQFDEPYTRPVDLGGGVYCVDLFERGQPERTCAYIVKERDRAAIVETGSAPLTWRLLRALEDLGIPPAAVEWVLVTHIHLDHSGGAGWLLERLPNAKIAVHPRGAPHLIDPSRLIAGAGVVYGPRFDALFAPIVPVPETRVLSVEDGGSVTLNGTRRFDIVHMAGHARHHFVIVDRTSDGVFTGDNAGVRFPEFRKYGLIPSIASTSPSEFDPPELDRTMGRLIGLGVSRFYYTHFSSASAADVAESRRWVQEFRKIGEEQGPAWEPIREQMKSRVTSELVSRGVPSAAPELGALALDLELNAKGVSVWLERRAKIRPSG